MANARQAALAERRSSLYGGGKIKILAPVQTGISSIAKQNAANETDIMISKYNAGQVDNVTMKAFLQTQLTSPYTSASDKTQIQTKLQDFDVLIEKDRLESVFKLAPDNSLQKEQAAQALAQFYTNRASTMVAGTPAHSQALENAGVWQQTVQGVQTSVSKQQRKNLENSLLQKINSLPTSSSERSTATADMYKQLYDMANAHGDPEDAQVYAAKYEQAQTYAKQYGEQEQAKSSVAQIKQFAAEQDLEIAKLTDKTSDELKAKAEKAYAVAQKYADIGDQLNYTKYMTIGTQAEEKYHKKIETMTASESAKAAFQSEKDYSDNIRLAQERYVNGMFSPPFTSAEEEYKDSLNKSVSEWMGTIENIYNTAVGMDANEKISWRGKNRRAGDVVDEIQKEYDKVSGIENAIESGTIMLKELPVSEGMGKNTPKYELVDVRNLSEEEAQLLIPDEIGILHPGEMGKKEITSREEYDQLMLDDPYRKDLDYNSKTGKYYQDSGLQFSVVDPETGQKYVQTPKDGKILSASSIREEARGLGYKDNETIDFNPEKAQQFQAAKDAGEIRAEGKTKEEVQKKMRDQVKAEQEQLAVEKAGEQAPGLVEKIAGVTDKILPKSPVISPTSEPRTLGQQLTDTVGKSPFSAVGEIVQNIQDPPKQTLTPTVKEPVNVQQAIQSGGIKINSQPQNRPQGLTYNTPAPVKPITYTPAQSVNIQQAVQSGGLSTPIKATPAPKPTTLQKIGTTISGAAGQALNKLKSIKWW
ncbi:MAG: hypothetical protein NUV86_09575 [Candidatus Scalindua sp.]|nr:hypothetical protein [Candidatus Scalindua sp.]